MYCSEIDLVRISRRALHQNPYYSVIDLAWISQNETLEKGIFDQEAENFSFVLIKENQTVRLSTKLRKKGPQI